MRSSPPRPFRFKTALCFQLRIVPDALPAAHRALRCSLFFAAAEPLFRADVERLLEEVSKGKAGSKKDK